MKYTYYPGCSLHSTAIEYHESTTSVFRELGLELIELPDWNCCGSTSSHALNRFLSYALPLRNLIKAEKMGCDIMTPCASCYHILKLADQRVRRDEKNAQKVNIKMSRIMGKSYRGLIEVKHLLEILVQDATLDALRGKINYLLHGLRLATYYGCLLRPSSVSFERDPEQPEFLDKIVTILGAESVKWTHKTECCGASLAISKTSLADALIKEIIKAAQDAGAQALVTVCPLCHSNLDLHQDPSSNGECLPVFYITELVGVAMGLADYHKWFKRHFIIPDNIFGRGFTFAPKKGGSL